VTENRYNGDPIMQSDEVNRIRLSKRKKTSIINRAQKQPVSKILTSETLGETFEYNLTDDSSPPKIARLAPEDS